MKLISPWAATAQSDIKNSAVLLEKRFLDYTFTLYNTGNSVWIVSTAANGNKLGFRAAFGLNCDFEVIESNEGDAGCTLLLQTSIGQYKVDMDFPDTENTIIHYKATFTPAIPVVIPFWPKDIVPLTEKGSIENTSATIHLHQAGTRSGLLFASTSVPKKGSFLYFQNLTALSDYCNATETSLAETVGGDWPEIGFSLPVSKEKAIAAATDYVVSDAYVLFSPEVPSDDIAVSKQYLNHLAAIYNIIPKSDTKYHDWLTTSKTALNDLTFNKGCWTYTKGHPYLNAYLCDYKTPAEIMVQLSVLYAVHEYAQWTGESFPVIDEIKGGLQSFYDDKLKTISRWLPSQRGELDESEEQKKAMTMDSWYLHHPLMNLSKLALDGDKEAKELLLDSIDYAIKVAHHFNYEWPVFYKMDTLENLKAETVPGSGGEKDVAGGYAHLMVNVWKVTGEKKYLNEALKAARKLQDMGMNIFYQANNTAFSALAMLRLYRETKEELFLDISYLCIAGIMKNVQLWECNYGNAVNFDNFFGIFPLNDAPYKAAYEEMEVYAALNDYIKEAVAMRAPVLPSVMLLLPELVRYSINRLPGYYPPLLPEDILSDEVKTGEVDPKLWIPVEDLQDGWEQHGQVGQEVYGAGVGFGVVPRQYVKIEEGDFILFTDYPITSFTKAKDGSLGFTIIGSENFTSRLILLANDDKKTLRNIKVSLAKGDKDLILTSAKSSAKSVEYDVTGGQKIILRF